VKTGGREAQEQAMQTPEFYNAETEELYSWFNEEADRLGKLKAVA
jgi:hypothetical protein